MRQGSHARSVPADVPRDRRVSGETPAPRRPGMPLHAPGAGEGAGRGPASGPLATTPSWSSRGTARRPGLFAGSSTATRSTAEASAADPTPAQNAGRCKPSRGTRLAPRRTRRDPGTPARRPTRPAGHITYAQVVPTAIERQLAKPCPTRWAWDSADGARTLAASGARGGNGHLTAARPDIEHAHLHGPS